MKFFFLSLISIFSSTYASSIEISSITELKSYVNSDTLVIFDLDNTVYQGAREDCHANWFYRRIQSEKEAGTLSSEVKRQVYAEWEESQNSCPVELVESETLFEIEQLQTRDVKVMALTARGPGSSNSTLNQLKSLGISFQDSALSSDPVEFRLQATALLEDGVLFVSPYNSKGNILKSYFEQIGYQPKRIILVDDLIENIDSLEKEFPNIDFIGLHYTVLANRLSTNL